MSRLPGFSVNVRTREHEHDVDFNLDQFLQSFQLSKKIEAAKKVLR
jgi:hypothetical protein